MVEKRLFKTLEPFRSPLYPFLYVVDDKMAIGSILQSLPERHGLEVGFGNEPTHVFHIDNNLPWILTEPDELDFHAFKISIRIWWEDVNFQIVQVHHPIIALKTHSTRNMDRAAQVVVYRNPDYGYMGMIPYQELRPGQRVVFVVDMLHAEQEMPMYVKFLRRYGYDPHMLQLRPKELPSLTWHSPFAPDDYVLDITK